MRCLILALALMSAPVGANAQWGRGWESATLTDSRPLQGVYGAYHCEYRTMGGYEFAIRSRSMCPYSVQINIETGQVRRR